MNWTGHIHWRLDGNKEMGDNIIILSVAQSIAALNFSITSPRRQDSRYYWCSYILQGLQLATCHLRSLLAPTLSIETVLSCNRQVNKVSIRIACPPTQCMAIPTFKFIVLNRWHFGMVIETLTITRHHLSMNCIKIQDLSFISIYYLHRCHFHCGRS